jgi:RNA polymerase sigma-70 factor (ECF subfamily)
MIEILGSARTYRGGASLERWASRIAARTAIRAARERRARSSAIESEADPEEIADAPDASTPDASEPSVLTLLGRLSEPRRECLVLRHVHEYSVEEIAELSGVSVNTVKDRLLQGRAQLRKMLRQETLIESVAAAPRPARRSR